MENIRKHIETSLADAERQYNDVYARYFRAKAELLEHQDKFDRLSHYYIMTGDNLEYYQNLLNKLNEKEK